MLTRIDNECLPSQVEHLYYYDRLHMTVCFINLIRHSIICGTAAGTDHVILKHITLLQSLQTFHHTVRMLHWCLISISNSYPQKTMNTICLACKVTSCITKVNNNKMCEREGKCIYVALIFVVHARRSGMDHTVLSAITPMPGFIPRKHHQMAPPRLRLQTCNCSLLLIYLSQRMKGWVGLVGWPTADGLPM